jgi:CRP-like cAMP-binding protein
MVLFADLDESDFSKIHAPIDDLDYAPGAVLAQEGGRAPGLFTLRSGMVKLVRTTSDGRSPSDTQLVTLFSREDIGSMVDLKMETVSREVSHLVREGVLEPLDKQGYEID